MASEKAIMRERIKELYQQNSVVGNDLRAKELYNLLFDLDSYTLQQLEKFIRERKV